MLKKWTAVCLALTLIFVPATLAVVPPHAHVAIAKGYRSGVKSFHSTTTQTNRGSFFTRKTQTTQTTNRPSVGGSFLRGAIFGGLSGLLLGHLFSHMGGFGMFAGLLINIIGMLVVLALIRYLFVRFTRRRREDNDQWRR
ncbi:MAG: hypothetical protein ABF868_08820 [Sporolactobacillus sp.]